MQGELSLDGQAAQVTGKDRGDHQKTRQERKRGIGRLPRQELFHPFAGDEQERHGHRGPVPVAHRHGDRHGEQDVGKRRAEPAADGDHGDVQHAVADSRDVAAGEQVGSPQHPPADNHVVRRREQEDGVRRGQLGGRQVEERQGRSDDENADPARGDQPPLHGQRAGEVRRAMPLRANRAFEPGPEQCRMAQHGGVARIGRTAASLKRSRACTGMATHHGVDW